MKESSSFKALLLLAVVLVSCKTANRNTAGRATENRCSNYHQLTYDSTYANVINVLGAPDAEVSTGPPEAKIPNIWLGYKKCEYMVLMIYRDLPKRGVFDKLRTRYLGTKGTNPERTLHVAKDEFKVLLDAYPLH